MRRADRAIAALAGLLLLVGAACGGGAGTSTDDQTDALATAFLADKGKPEFFTAADAHCLAQVYVGIFRDDLNRKGLTPQQLRDPKNLARIPEPTTTQRVRIADGVQHCRLGRLFVRGMAQKFRAPDADKVDVCLAKQVDHGTEARDLLADSIDGDGKLSDQTVASFVAILDHCMDLASLALDQANIPVDDAQRACIINRVRNTDALLAVMRRRMSGVKLTEADYRRAILPSLIKCLPEGTFDPAP
jgi:hypothetical protein